MSYILSNKMFHNSLTFSKIHENDGYNKIVDNILTRHFQENYILHLTYMVMSCSTKEHKKR